MRRWRTYSDIPVQLSRSTWFFQDDVDELVRLGINTVRIPVSRMENFCITLTKANISCQLGYWIIEELVERETEFYPRGGLQQLVGPLSPLSSPADPTVHVASWSASAQGSRH